LSKIKCSLITHSHKKFKKAEMSLLRKICKTGNKSRVTSVLGCQWGDEGKGKLVDILAEQHDIVARFNGGSNAGHTLKVGNIKFAFHLLPCGMLYPNKLNVIGNGVVIHIPALFEELKQLDQHKIDWDSRLIISDRAHLTFKAHLAMDRLFEQKLFLGTTKRGIGPTYGLKSFRWGVRVGELKNWDSFLAKYAQFNDFVTQTYGIEVDRAQELSELKHYRDILIEKKMIQDTVGLMHDALKNKRILTEGANAIMLDVDFGTYPYVTSSNTSVGAICTGLGIPPQKLETVLGVVKAYTTRVGEGPFPSEIESWEGALMQKVGGEFGSTTGRPRRCGWLDLSVVRYANMINCLSSINLTKLDVLSEFNEIEVVTHYERKSTGQRVDYLDACLEEWQDMRTVSTKLKGWSSDISKVTSYADLPVEARDYVDFIEKET
jgi:adenylosuccinate synthase